MTFSCRLGFSLMDPCSARRQGNGWGQGLRILPVQSFDIKVRLWLQAVSAASHRSIG